MATNSIINSLQMVLDAGRIVSQCCLRVRGLILTLRLILQVEFDTPRVLLSREGGFLKALVQESADKDILREMADKGPRRERAL